MQSQSRSQHIAIDGAIEIGMFLRFDTHSRVLNKQHLQIKI